MNTLVCAPVICGQVVWAVVAAFLIGLVSAWIELEVTWTGIRFTVWTWDVNFHRRARRGWNEFIRRQDDYSTHYVWGRLSLHVENWSLEVHPVCAECGSASIGEQSCGDEGWTVCGSCQSVEQGYRYVNLRDYNEAD